MKAWTLRNKVRNSIPLGRRERGRREGKGWRKEIIREVITVVQKGRCRARPAGRAVRKVRPT
jgi:hypothetical protein